MQCILRWYKITIISCKLFSSFKSINLLLKLSYSSLSLIDLIPNHLLCWLIFILLLIIRVLLDTLLFDLNTKSSYLLYQVNIFLHDSNVFMFVNITVFLKILLQHVDWFVQIFLLILVLLFNLTIHFHLNYTLWTEFVL